MIGINTIAFLDSTQCGLIATSSLMKMEATVSLKL